MEDEGWLRFSFLRICPHRIYETQVVATIVGGRVVYASRAQ
jgi:predicted amidohydrolase YtcJ